MPIESIDRSKKIPNFSARYQNIEQSRQPATVEVKIDGKVVPQSAVESLVLEQVIGDHTILAIEIRRKADLEASFGATLEANAKAWISKTISLKITASDKSAGDSGEVNFTGIVVSAHMGSVVGSLGNVFLRCLSPTIMLDINKMYRTWVDSKTEEILNSLISSEAMPNASVSASGEHESFPVFSHTARQRLN